MSTKKVATKSPVETKEKIPPSSQPKVTSKLSTEIKEKVSPSSEAKGVGKKGKVISSSQAKGAEEKKIRHKKRSETFSTYIFKIFKQVHPKIGISKKGMNVMNSFVTDIFEKNCKRRCHFGFNE
jgi:hypothetical protein